MVRRPLFLLALSLTVCGTAGPIVARDTYPRQPIDVEHYRFAVTLGDDTDRITGVAVVPTEEGGESNGEEMGGEEGEGAAAPAVDGAAAE